MRLHCCALLLGLIALLLGQTVAMGADAPAPAKAGDAAPKAAAKPAPAAPLPAAETPAASGKPEEGERRPIEILPAPLNNVACNVADLEKTGQLVVTEVALGWAEDFGDEALIWTVKVLKPITCRHAEILLRRVSDVRFYHAAEKSEKELYSARLYFSPRIAEGAVHGEILQPDETFQVWVLLTSAQAALLARQQVDHLVFHEPQTRRVPPLSVSSTQWNVAVSKIPRWFTARQKKDRLSP